MALQYGMNITASDMKSLLEKNDKQKNGVRTWRELFGGKSLGYQTQIGTLTSDYTNTISEAYKANLARNNAIMNSGLNVGATQEAIMASRRDLHDAYQNYVSNYGSAITKATEDYATERNIIDKGLTERATNFADLYNSAYKYLSEELFGATQTVTGNAENGAAPKYEGKGKKAKFVGYEDVNRDYINEHGLQWAYETDEDGNYTNQLRDWTSLSHDLFNADDSLTDKGVQFFDQMFNTPYENYMHVSGERNIRGFDEWLSDTNSELRDWWIGQDQFNYNFAGTNRGTSQIMTGRESTDTIYGDYEYPNAHGLSEYASKVFDSTEASAALKRKATAQQAARDMAQNAKTAGGRLKDAYKGAESGYGAAASIEDRKAKEAWNTYISSVTSTKDELSTFFQNKVGSSLAADFWTENERLDARYNALVKEAKRKGYYDESLVKRVDAWYDDLLKQMETYIKKHGYTGKISGF